METNINNENIENENIENKSSLEVSETTLQAMASTSKWVRFQIVLMCIAIVCCIIAGIIFIAMPQVAYPGKPTGAVIMGAFYIILSLVYLLPITYLHKNAKGLKQTYLTHDSGQFAVAMKNNKRYWKFMGILSIVAISLVIIGTIVVIIAACYKGYCPMDVAEMAI